MSLNILTPTGGPDVTRQNKRGLVYITTDPTANNEADVTAEGSVRIAIHPADDAAHIERLKDGAWNDSGLRVGANSLEVGRELRISAGGEWILTEDASQNFKALVAEIAFDDATGTEPAPRIPKLGPIVTKDILQPNDSFQINAGPGNPIEFQYTSTNDRLSRLAYIRTGSVQPTAVVTASAWKNGLDGTLVFQRKFSPITFGPNQEFQLIIDGLVEIVTGEFIGIRFESTGPFSLLGAPPPIPGAPLGFPWWALDYFPLELETLVSFEQGLNRILTSFDGAVLVNSSGDILTSGMGLIPGVDT